VRRVALDCIPDGGSTKIFVKRGNRAMRALLKPIYQVTERVLADGAIDAKYSFYPLFLDSK
jgi:hypothetical protein